MAWIRQNKKTKELIIAADSRLRSRGALDQAQKIFRLERRDCCLAFCGDAQIAYPLFIQVASFINAFIRTRTRAQDITDVANIIREVLNNLVASWDLSAAEKSEELSNTRVLFGGWSWKLQRFDVGIFKFTDDSFSFHHEKARLPHPWKEIGRSLIVIGDYQKEYLLYLARILEGRHGQQIIRAPKKEVHFDYEPIEALSLMLRETAGKQDFKSIGGAPQMLKLYPYGSDLPVVIRNEGGDNYLFGRKLFSWEKTTYPVLLLNSDKPQFLYPLSSVPLPKNLPVVEADEQDGVEG